MVDEHGRMERRRRVPDVLEREKRRVPLAAPDAPPPDTAGPDAGHADGDALPDVTPPDTTYWQGLDSKHRFGLVAGIVGGVIVAAAIGVGLYFSLRPAEPAPKGVNGPSAIVPSEVPSSSVAATGSAPTTGPVEPTATPPGAVASSAVRAPYIAYRAGGSIWVSGQRGGNARSVYEAQSGLFALSPNALTIAYVDPGAGTLRMIDVTTKRTTVVGPAAPVRPVWAPDSSFVLFQRMSGAGVDDVWRVKSDGTGAMLVMRGVGGRLLADGRSVIAAPILTGPTSVVAWMAGSTTLQGRQKVSSTEVCPAAKGVYFADAGGIAGAGGASSPPSLRYIGYDGKGERTVVAKPASGARAAFSDLALSPDGTWLVYSESGDDGFSRVFALRTAGGTPVSLTPRLDGYFMNWSADGTELFLAEGNAIQGEATRISAMRPDGGGHRVVVEGGGL
jgi:hypothetical protein